MARQQPRAVRAHRGAQHGRRLHRGAVRAGGLPRGARDTRGRRDRRRALGGEHRLPVAAVAVGGKVIKCRFQSQRAQRYIRL